MSVRHALLAVVVLVGAVWLWPVAEPVPSPRSADGVAAPAGGATPVAGTLAPKVSDAATDGELMAASQRQAVDTPTRYKKIRGLVTRAGVPQRDRFVVCYRGWGQSQDRERTDQNGRFEFEVDPHDYEILVQPERGRAVNNPAYERMPVTVMSFLVAARAYAKVTDKDLDLHLELPTQAIVVQVRDKVTRLPVAGATLRWQPPPIVMQELILLGDETGYVRIADVRPGSHSVSAEARAYKQAEKSLEIVSDGPDGLVELLLEPTCAADVVLTGADDAPVAISPAHFATLASVSNHREWAGPTRAGQRWPRPTSMEYDNLAPGRYRLMFSSDEASDDDGVTAVRYVPCLPVGEKYRIVELQKGRVVRIEVPVVQRSFVRLRVVDLQDNLIEGALDVTCVGEDGATVRARSWGYVKRDSKTHFEGYLPRGRYALTFVAGKRTWREELVVAKDVIDVSIRPRW